MDPHTPHPEEEEQYTPLPAGGTLEIAEGTLGAPQGLLCLSVCSSKHI